MLTIGSMLVTLILAIPIALYSAVRETNRVSWTLTMFAYVVSALPVFWLGYIVIYFLPISSACSLWPSVLPGGARVRLALFPSARLRARRGQRHHQRGHPLSPGGDEQGDGRGLHPYSPRQGASV